MYDFYEPPREKYQLSDYDYFNIVSYPYFKRYAIKKGYKTTKNDGKKMVEQVDIHSKEKLMELSASYVSAVFIREKAFEKETNRKITILFLVVCLIGIALGVLLAWGVFEKNLLDLIRNLF